MPSEAKNKSALRVLVLYNLAQADGVRPGRSFQESDAGVLEEVGSVTAALESLGLDYRLEGIARLDDLPDVFSRGGEQVVFNLVEDFPGRSLEASAVPAVCRGYAKACTGNDTPCLTRALDKEEAKKALRAAGLACPQGFTVAAGQELNRRDLPEGLYIVKPLRTDASEGINQQAVAPGSGRELEKAVQRVHERLGQPAVVERFVGDRELNVSLLEVEGRIEVLPIAEIDFSAFPPDLHRIVDYSAKWRLNSFAYHHTPRLLPAPLPPKLASRVRDQSLRAWKALGCRDYARVDFRLEDSASRLYILEVNPNPDIAPDGGFSAALGAAGISFSRFVRVLLDNALGRFPA